MFFLAFLTTRVTFIQMSCVIRATWALWLTERQKTMLKVGKIMIRYDRSYRHPASSFPDE
jgi:hypothetical protein